jgi:predicted GIY-YIG superfamily endonuclease
MVFWTYLLRCVDGRYYAGHTDNLELRIAQHQSGSRADLRFTAGRLCCFGHKNSLADTRHYRQNGKLKAGRGRKKRRWLMVIGTRFLGWQSRSQNLEVSW